MAKYYVHLRCRGCLVPVVSEVLLEVSEVSEALLEVSVLEFPVLRWLAVLFAEVLLYQAAAQCGAYW